MFEGDPTDPCACGNVGANMNIDDVWSVRGTCGNAFQHGELFEQEIIISQQSCGRWCSDGDGDRVCAWPCCEFGTLFDRPSCAAQGYARAFAAVCGRDH